MPHILSHSTGLGSNHEEDFHHASPDDDFLKTNFWLPDVPENVTYYTNVGASCIALTTERISGVSFKQYVRDNILNQLNIPNTEGSYRMSSFEMRKTDLVEHYVYNISLLDIYHWIVPQLTVVQIQ